jgi:hypothetical protein
MLHDYVAAKMTIVVPNNYHTRPVQARQYKKLVCGLINSCNSTSFKDFAVLASIVTMPAKDININIEGIRRPIFGYLLMSNKRAWFTFS